MTELTTVRLSGSSGSTGEPFDIPGGSTPVWVVRLHAEPTRAFTLLVTFPRGWERPVVGHYLCAEDVVFLSGRLRIGDETFAGGDWAHMPAGWVRAGMRAESETVALARFDGPARWVEGRPASATLPLLRRRLADLADLTDGPLGRAQLLRHGEPDSSWLVTAPLAAGEPSPMDAQILDLVERSWHLVPTGAPMPPLPGDAFAWTFEA